MKTDYKSCDFVCTVKGKDNTYIVNRVVNSNNDTMYVIMKDTTELYSCYESNFKEMLNSFLKQVEGVVVQ